MPEPWNGNELGHRRLVTVVLRLVLDHRNVLVHGDIVDGSNRVQGRFAGWERLAPALRGWLESGQPDGEQVPVTDTESDETRDRKDRPCP